MKNTYFDVVVVAPGFEDNEKESGLFWDTELRLQAAIVLYEKSEVKKIIVGGGKLRKMKKSFAFLMKEYLMRRGIPENIIQTEEYTYDTPSQFQWIKNNIEGEFDFITDPVQAGHVRELLKGFDIKDCTILSTEDILSDDELYGTFFKYTHQSFYWRKWIIREKILELFTKFFDPRGELISRLTSKRKNN